MLISGYFPFSTSLLSDCKAAGGQEELKQKLKQYKLTFGWEFRKHPELKDLCKRMLDFDVNKRPTAAESLMHPWFTRHLEKRQGSWDKLFRRLFLTVA